MEADAELRAEAEKSLRAVDGQLAWGERAGLTFAGISLGSILLLAALGILLLWPVIQRQRWEIGCFVLVAVVATGFALTWSAPLWELPVIGAVLKSAQFPWRWLSITSLCVSVLSGLALHTQIALPTRLPTLPLLTLVGAVLLSSYGYLQVRIEAPAEGQVSLAALMRFQQSSDELTGSTAWVKEIPTWSDAADYYIDQDEKGETVQPVTSLLDTTAPSTTRQRFPRSRPQNRSHRRVEEVKLPHDGVWIRHLVTVRVEARVPALLVRGPAHGSRVAQQTGQRLK